VPHLKTMHKEDNDTDDENEDLKTERWVEIGGFKILENTLKKCQFKT